MNAAKRFIKHGNPNPQAAPTPFVAYFRRVGVFGAKGSLTQGSFFAGVWENLCVGVEPPSHVYSSGEPKIISFYDLAIKGIGRATFDVIK